MKPNCKYKHLYILLLNLYQDTSCPVWFFCLLLILSPWPLCSSLPAALSGSVAVCRPSSRGWQAPDISWELVSIHVTSQALISLIAFGNGTPPVLELWNSVWSWRQTVTLVPPLTFGIKPMLCVTSDWLFLRVCHVAGEALLLRRSPAVSTVRHPRRTPVIPCCSTAPWSSEAATGGRRGISSCLATCCS